MNTSNCFVNITYGIILYNTETFVVSFLCIVCCGYNSEVIDNPPSPPIGLQSYTIIKQECWEEIFSFGVIVNHDFTVQEGPRTGPSNFGSIQQQCFGSILSQSLDPCRVCSWALNHDFWGLEASL